MGGQYAPYYLPQQMGGLPPDAPVGAYTDAQYLSDISGIRADIENQYGDILRQLGYVDPDTGQFIPGSVIQQANLDESNLAAQMQAADLANTQAMQQSGTLFSGMRAVQQAQAEAPFLQNIGQIELQTPTQLADLYGQAGHLITDFTNRQNDALSAAALRHTTEVEQNPPADGGGQRPVDQGPGPGGTGTSVGTPTPTPTPTPTQPTAPVTQTIPGGEQVQRGHPSSRTSIQTLPWYSAPPVQYMATGGEIGRPISAVMGENAIPGVPSTHEVVVPRGGLTAGENEQLSNLAQAAHARMQGNMIRRPPPIAGPPQGIHWFGPGGAGVWYPGGNPAGPPVRPGPIGMPPPGGAVGMPEGPPIVMRGGEPVMHGLPPAVHPPIEQWMMRHPGALGGRAPIPRWAALAMAARERLMGPHSTPLQLLQEPGVPVARFAS